jgi:glycerophosphoryl diester phosphodiesterase
VRTRGATVTPNTTGRLTIDTMPPSAPLIVAAAGLTDRGAPRNSLQAFADAVTHGAEMVEFDVRACADALVVGHDAVIDGVRSSDHTYAELSRRLGEHTPPLLSVVLAIVGGRVAVDCEIKEAGHEAEVVDLLRRHCDTTNAVVTSFQESVVSRVKQLWPELRCGLLLPLPAEFRGRDSGLPALEAAVACSADFVAIEERELSEAFLAGAVTAQLHVLVWEVNDAARLAALMHDDRIVAICTDQPRVAQAVRRQVAATAPREPRRAGFVI